MNLILTVYAIIFLLNIIDLAKNYQEVNALRKDLLEEIQGHKSYNVKAKNKTLQIRYILFSLITFVWLVFGFLFTSNDWIYAIIFLLLFVKNKVGVILIMLVTLFLIANYKLGLSFDDVLQIIGYAQ